MPFAPMPGFPARAVGVADVLASPKWPAEWPYSPRDFMRGDESPDPYFYDQPRFCFHVDDAAVAALTEFYGTALREWEKPAILDICASHVSHFPTDIADFAGNRVALGMNEEELRNNGQVDSYVVKDLNEDPTLPFEDNSFDVVTNVVSIDYLTKPLAICKEIRSVLKPGGQALMALSNDASRRRPSTSGSGRTTSSTSSWLAPTSTTRGASSPRRRWRSRRTRTRSPGPAAGRRTLPI